MSLTGILWLALFISFCLASAVRPVYASLANSMVFFASPVFWWFGSGFLTTLTMRWSLVAAAVMIVANLIHWQDRPRISSMSNRLLFLIVAIALNAFVVNSLLANYPQESNKVFDILWKGCLTSVLLHFSLRSKEDLQLFLISIVIGCGFVGYQVVLAGQGSIEGGRLEGFSFPGAQGSNGGSAVLSLGLSLAGYFVISTENRRFAFISLICAPLILETILRCNSRGAYLGLIAAAMAMVVFSRGPSHRRAIWLCVVGVVSVVFLAKNEAIFERFQSIFAYEEERDKSAAERVLYWKAAFKMIQDYPLGSGGEAAFTSPRGIQYIQHFRPEFRSVHNGPLDIAAGWGIQGLLLLVALLGSSALWTYRASITHLRNGETGQSFLGVVLLAVLADQLICSSFTSVLDGEWFLWIAVCCHAYSRFANDTMLTAANTEIDEATHETVIHDVLKSV